VLPRQGHDKNVSALDFRTAPFASQSKKIFTLPGAHYCDEP